MSKSVDDIATKDLLAKLQSLGLSEKEGLVYLALLPRQDVGSSVLIRATGLHGQFVYDALTRLEALGLARHVILNGRKKFSAGSPERILSLVEEKRLSALSVVRQLHRQFAGKHEQSFEIFQGQAAFVANEFAIMEALPEGSTIDVLGGSEDTYVGLFGPELDEFERLRINKRITVRYISTNGNRSYLQVMAQSRRFFEIRVLPESASGVETDIVLNKIVFHLYGDPVVSFVFSNQLIADGYRRFFEVLWGLSSRL